MGINPNKEGPGRNQSLGWSRGWQASNKRARQAKQITVRRLMLSSKVFKSSRDDEAKVRRLTRGKWKPVPAARS